MIIFLAIYLKVIPMVGEGLDIWQVVILLPKLKLSV